MVLYYVIILHDYNISLNKLKFYICGIFSQFTLFLGNVAFVSQGGLKTSVFSVSRFILHLMALTASNSFWEIGGI